MRIIPLSALASFVTLFVGCGQPAPFEQRAAAITHGVEDPGHQAVGKLTVTKLDSNTATCTGTLVGRRVVLTAAHCVVGELPHTYETEGQVYNATRVVLHDQWDPDPQVISLHDIAVMFIDGDPPVRPARVSGEAVTVGQELTLVGWGQQEPEADPAPPHRRKATNFVDQLEETRFRFSGTGAGVGGTCDGDSGSPALAMVDGMEQVVGVTSVAESETCGVATWDTKLDVHLPWLEGASEGDLTNLDDTPPSVTITRPADGAQAQWPLQVEAEITDALPGVIGELHFDGVLAQKLTSPPFTFSLDGCLGAQCAGQGEVAHVVVVKGIDAAGNSGEAQITVRLTGSGQAADGGGPAGDGGSGADGGLPAGDGGGEVLSGGCGLLRGPPVAACWIGGLLVGLLLGRVWPRRQRRPRR